MAHRHSDDFKHEAVRIALTSGLTRRQVASDLGIGFSTLSKWVQISRTDETISVPDQDLFKEVERLRKEERNILKPARWREAKDRPRCSLRNKASEVCFC